MVDSTFASPSFCSTARDLVLNHYCRAACTFQRNLFTFEVIKPQAFCFREANELREKAKVIVIKKKNLPEKHEHTWHERRKREEKQMVSMILHDGDRKKNNSEMRSNGCFSK